VFNLAMNIIFFFVVNLLLVVFCYLYVIIKMA